MDLTDPSGVMVRVVADTHELASLPAQPTQVLHFGCSNAAAIEHQLEPQLGAHGIRVVSYTQEGTHLPLWGGRFSKVPHLVRQHDPDLIIRTSGEQRMSNFLLWQSAYSELYFCDPDWPAFRELDFLRALHAYASRPRRRGA